MKYDDPNTRDLLAASYVLNTLRGAARKRFEALVNTRIDWQMALDKWSTRLHLLADTLPAIEPPKRVWQSIQSRLYGSKPATERRWFDWWKALALGSSSLAAVLALLFMTSTPEKIEVPVEVAVIEQATTSVALLADADAKPGWMLALAKNKAGKTELRVNALASLKTVDDKSFELWILPADKSAPISLGVLPQQGHQQVVVSDKTAALLLQSGLAVSLEPVGGSPTGGPTGAVLYQGKLTEI